MLVAGSVAGCASAPTIPEFARQFDDDPIIVEDLGGGVTLIAVDATSEDDWTYVDLDAAALVVPRDPANDPTWDLAFQRFRVSANGGASGTGGVEIGLSRSTDFASPPGPDEVDWIVDRPGAGDRVRHAFTSRGDWFRYDIFTHSLASKEQVTLVRSTEGTVFKVQLVTYYDRLLLSGHPTFRYAKSS